MVNRIQNMREVTFIIGPQGSGKSQMAQRLGLIRQDLHIAFDDFPLRILYIHVRSVPEGQSVAYCIQTPDGYLLRDLAYLCFQAFADVGNTKGAVIELFNT